MKAVVIQSYGGKEVLKEQEMEMPNLQDNQVLVEVYATSVNPIDWKVREGYLKEMMPFEFPIILGWDVAGVVKEKGKAVDNVEIGERVFARPATTNRGTYAEYVAVDENLIAKMPDSMTFEEAAAIPLAGLTAYQCLVDFSSIKEGNRVLIHAGAGGVGTFAIQLAKAYGAYVYTTASGKNIEFLTSLGADRVINYKEENFWDVVNDLDIVLDTMGGDIQTKSFEVLKKGGTLVSIVQPPDEHLAKEKEVKAGLVWLEPNGEQLQLLATLFEEKKLQPIIGQEFPLTEKGVQDAHAVSETHHAKGKLVITAKKAE
ncbi:NADP-dependent oxidoreductase [Paenisporosarcina cavernae]|uniref:NADP-dependent oxidoreductase n=1 Tax=Paenisporosarcina cavernae TaxID=2320858 RepID=A0A385YVG1_9BACL|nr:NADP-dependent oxidoreductase [Paenisporosarcina cavernae]AYC30270.1 NADP-dependent oxidoreductase [Paenisporosarcina cavernae]